MISTGYTRSSYYFTKPITHNISYHPFMGKIALNDPFSMNQEVLIGDVMAIALVNMHEMRAIIMERLENCVEQEKTYCRAFKKPENIYLVNNLKILNNVCWLLLRLITYNS